MEQPGSEYKKSPNYFKRTTRFSFYKNILYKNIEDEMGQKVKKEYAHIALLLTKLRIHFVRIFILME